MNRAVLPAVLVPLLLAALTPAAAFAGAPRLAVAGTKGDTVVLLDMASRRTVDSKVEADGLLVFPPPPTGVEVTPTEGQAPAASAPAPDFGRVTLQFDCKARTIGLVRMSVLGANGAIIKQQAPATIDAQAPVDPTDARMLGYACGESFPKADNTFADEKAAITAIRKPG